MARTVYLHVGMGRCGSSAIQQFATDNCAKLLIRGVNYPSSRELGFQANHSSNALGLTQERPAEPERFAKLATRIAHLRGSRILLSSEFMYGRPLNEFNAIDEAFRSHELELKCIVYIREQREWLISRYAQAVKSKRWTMPLADYLRLAYRSTLLDYAARFKALCTVLKPEQIIIRIYERSKLVGRDVRSDLFSVMGVDVADLTSDDANTNASASVLEVETMRIVNSFVQEGFNHRAFLGVAQRMAKSKGWDSTKDLYRLVPPALLQEIGDYYAPRNAELRANFFPTASRPVFESRLPPTYEMLEASERFDERAIGMLLNHFGLKRAAEQSRVKALKSKLFELRTEIAKRGERLKAGKRRVKVLDSKLAKLKTEIVKRDQRLKAEQSRVRALDGEIANLSDEIRRSRLVLRHERASGSKTFFGGIRATLSTYPNTTRVRPSLYFHYLIGRRRKDAGNLALLAASGFFDSAYYLKRYKDVAKAGVDPLIHFVDFGAARGRNPSALFDTAYYLKHNPEVTTSNINPLLHYLLKGRNEGRDPKPPRLEKAPSHKQMPQSRAKNVGPNLALFQNRTSVL